MNSREQIPVGNHDRSSREGVWRTVALSILILAIVLIPVIFVVWVINGDRADARPPQPVGYEGFPSVHEGLGDALRSEAVAFVAAKAEVEWYEGALNARRAREAEAARSPASTPAATSSPAPAPSAPTASGGGRWDALAQCESGGNWSINSGNGYSGGLQFHPQTWNGYGGNAYAPYAYQASRSQQIAIAEKVLAAQGYGAWPFCSRKLGYR